MPRISNSVLVEENIPSLDRFNSVIQQKIPSLATGFSKRDSACQILSNLGEDLPQTLYSLIELKNNAREDSIKLQSVKILLGIHGISEHSAEETQSVGINIQINGQNTNVGAILIPDRGSF